MIPKSYTFSYQLLSSSCVKLETRYRIIHIWSNHYRSPKQDSNLGLSRIAVCEDCKANAQPLSHHSWIRAILKSTKNIHPLTTYNLFFNIAK